MTDSLRTAIPRALTAIAVAALLAGCTTSSPTPTAEAESAPPASSAPKADGWIEPTPEQAQAFVADVRRIDPNQIKPGSSVRTEEKVVSYGQRTCQDLWTKTVDQTVATAQKRWSWPDNPVSEETARKLVDAAHEQLCPGFPTR